MRRALPILALVGFAAGCASAPTTIYTLDPIAPAGGLVSGPASAYAGPAVRVDAVHVPPAMDRPELVTVAGAYRLQIHDLSHWAAPLGALSRRALTADLQARLPQGAVVFPDSPKPPGARSLVVEMLSLSSSPDGSVMEASWTLLPSTLGGPLRQREVRLTTAASSAAAAGPGGLAVDMSTLLAQLADSIAADLTAAPPAPEAPPPARPRA